MIAWCAASCCMPLLIRTRLKHLCPASVPLNLLSLPMDNRQPALPERFRFIPLPTPDWRIAMGWRHQTCASRDLLQTSLSTSENLHDKSPTTHCSPVRSRRFSRHPAWRRCEYQASAKRLHASPVSWPAHARTDYAASAFTCNRADVQYAPWRTCQEVPQAKSGKHTGCQLQAPALARQPSGVAGGCHQGRILPHEDCYA